MENAQEKLTVSPGEVLAKIAAAQRGEVELQDLERLLSVAPAAAAALRTIAADARRRALDVDLPQSAVSAALTEATTADFDAVRMEHALSGLEELASERREEMLRARFLARYQAARDRRDKCAERIRTEYPDLQAGLLSLVEEIVAAGMEVDRANQTLPDGAEELARPEGFARGFIDRTGSEDLPLNARITRISQMIIPDFSHPENLAWPPGFLRHVQGDRAHTFAEILAAYNKTRRRPPV